MLKHDTTECQARVIELPHFQRAEVRFVLRLLYTGQVEPSEWEAPAASESGVCSRPSRAMASAPFSSSASVQWLGVAVWLL